MSTQIFLEHRAFLMLRFFLLLRSDTDTLPDGVRFATRTLPEAVVLFGATHGIVGRLV
jgi:hypothetical protein